MCISSWCFFCSVFTWTAELLGMLKSYSFSLLFFFPEVINHKWVFVLSEDVALEKYPIFANVCQLAIWLQHSDQSQSSTQDSRALGQCEVMCWGTGAVTSSFCVFNEPKRQWFACRSWLCSQFDHWASRSFWTWTFTSTCAWKCGCGNKADCWSAGLANYFWKESSVIYLLWGKKLIDIFLLFVLPSFALFSGPVSVLAYLRAHLRKAEPSKQLKLLVIGPPRQGKTALFDILQNGKASPFTPAERCISTSTWELEKPNGGKNNVILTKVIIAVTGIFSFLQLIYY